MIKLHDRFKKTLKEMIEKKKKKLASLQAQLDELLQQLEAEVTYTYLMTCTSLMITNRQLRMRR